MLSTQEFLATLSCYQDKSLVFEYGPAKRVAPGYHVTEVMNATYQSMDCGGNSHFWRETVVQLQGPGSKDKPEFMRVRKFLDIYGRVVATVPVRPEAEMRFEYGDLETPAIHYHVGAVGLEGEQVVVRLSPPGVVCKPSLSKANCRVPASGIELEVVGQGGCCD